SVPPFDVTDLSVSDVVLGLRQNAGPLSDGTPSMAIVPTTARIFSAGTPAWAFLRVYRPPAMRDASPVDLDITVLDRAGERVKYQSQHLSVADRTADVRLALPFKSLAPGDYVLKIDATQDRGDVSRAIGFTVARAPVAVKQEHSPELDAALEAA